MAGFIGVHTGAGKYQDRLVPRYKRICKMACQKGIEILADGGSALDAVEATTVVLEDDPLTNAAYGSNLTTDGLVECDASIMNGETLLFGSVGAVSGVKNPIQLARHIHDMQLQVTLSLGRIPPCFLVGSGALQLAQKNPNIVVVEPETLVSRRSMRMYIQYKKRLDICENNLNKLVSKNVVPNNGLPLDTVGVVCVDNEGNMAASCSSGGICLKQPGRLGSAAIYGCGCWAENGCSTDDRSVAVTTSGSGEYIIRTCLARDVAQDLKTTSLLPSQSLNLTIDKFIRSRFLRYADKKLCGVIAMSCNNADKEFLWAHTTADMCIGYMNITSRKCVSRLSRLPENVESGKNVIVSGINISS